MEFIVTFKTGAVQRFAAPNWQEVGQRATSVANNKHTTVLKIELYEDWAGKFICIPIDLG